MRENRIFILLLFLSTLVLYCTDEKVRSLAEQNEENTELIPGSISRIESSGFFITPDKPLLEYHSWKMFDNNLSSNWFEAADSPAETPAIQIHFQQPVSADGIRIIPFNHQSPGYLYYNRA
ncbi:MAG: hypothetical protein JW904_03590, partial [Spirochaetales bacterium]|nr:hypothetical protein [Spirochaetales bacterium]